MGFSFGIIDVLVLAILLIHWFFDRKLARRRQENRQILLRIGLGAVLILYGLHIGTVWPFIVVVAFGVVGHLHEKWESRKQMQRLRDLYR